MKTERAVAPSRGLHVGLWTVQILLACLFFIAGVMKTSQPIDQLATALPWTRDVSVGLVRFIGISEIIGALGLVLPAATRIAPRLTGLAGFGLALVMALAIGFHATRGEYSMMPLPIALFLLVGFVAWGRLFRAPIAPGGVSRPTGPAARV